MKNLKLLVRSRNKIRDIIAYLQGNYRYKLYYSDSKFIRKLMREHIREQIDFRIKVMFPECFMKGQCVKCGCSTTKLQMANKACEMPCYPVMMTEIQWRLFLHKGCHTDKHGIWYLKYENNKVINLGFKPKC